MKFYRKVTQAVPNGADFIESRGRSFADEWPVAEDYVIQSGLVRPRVGGKPVAREYLPMAQPELPAEFAKVGGGDGEGAVLGFIRRYGLLGYAQAWRFPFEELGAARSRFYTPNLAGDPVPWLVAHARAVALVGELARALDEPEALSLQIGQLTVRAATGDEMLAFSVPGRGRTRPGQVQMRPRKSPRESALEIIAHILNENLDGVSRTLLVEPQDDRRLGLTSLFTPLNLLDAIYWLLADAVVGARVRSCLACKRFFMATSDRMKFCPPPMGLAGVSRCMNRFKQQQFRERKAARAKGGERRRGRKRAQAKTAVSIKATHRRS